MNTNWGGNKVLSGRTSAQSLSFAATSDISITISCCTCVRRSECSWLHSILLLWIFQTMALNKRFRISIPHKFPIPISSSAFVAKLPPFLRVEYESDLRVWYKSIYNGIVEETSANRETFWKFWRSYCKPLGIDPYLEKANFQTKTRFVTGLAGRVRNCTHSRGK